MFNSYIYIYIYKPLFVLSSRVWLHFNLLPKFHCRHCLSRYRDHWSDLQIHKITHL